MLAVALRGSMEKADKSLGDVRGRGGEEKKALWRQSLADQAEEELWPQQG